MEVITTIIGSWWLKWDNVPGTQLALVTVRLMLVPFPTPSHWCQLCGCLVLHFHLPRFPKCTGLRLPEENCTVSSEKSRRRNLTPMPFVHLLPSQDCHLGLLVLSSDWNQQDPHIVFPFELVPCCLTKHSNFKRLLFQTLFRNQSKVFLRSQSR